MESGNELGTSITSFQANMMFQTIPSQSALAQLLIRDLEH